MVGYEVGLPRVRGDNEERDGGIREEGGGMPGGERPIGKGGVRAGPDDEIFARY